MDMLVSGRDAPSIPTDGIGRSRKKEGRFHFRLSRKGFHNRDGYSPFIKLSPASKEVLFFFQFFFHQSDEVNKDWCLKTHPFSHQTKTPVLVCQPFFLCKKSKVGSIFPNLPKIILLNPKGAKAVRVFEGRWTQDLPSIYHRIYNFFCPKFKIVGIKNTRHPTNLWSTSTVFVPYTSQQKQIQTRNPLQTSFL